MARAVSLRPFPYVLVRERALPKSEQTTWLARRISAPEMEEVGNAIEAHHDGEKPEMDFTINRERVNNAFLRWGLCGWENFLDECGKPVAFIPRQNGGPCAWENISLIEADDRAELAGVIENGSRLTGDDIKNCESAPG